MGLLDLKSHGVLSGGCDTDCMLITELIITSSVVRGIPTVVTFLILSMDKY